MIVTNRQELLFIYETKDCNPNGDPLDENKPRTDPETGVATVTDVRIKRTIRDYLHAAKGLEILVRDTFDAEGYLKDGKGRCEDFYSGAGINDKDTIVSLVSKVEKAILNTCIDARLFGCTLPVEYGSGAKAKKSSIRLTGPVQFSGFNRSLHRVAPIFVQGTAGFASGKQSTQKSFREDHIIPYACITSYGVVNEIAAKSTQLKNTDVDLLIEGIWKGTESLISRSKMGHQPLMLMRIIYRDGYRIGDLSGRIKLCSKKEDIQIRSVDDFVIDVSSLVSSILSAKDKIEKIEVKQDDRLRFSDDGKENLFSNLTRLKDLSIQPLTIG